MNISYFITKPLPFLQKLDPQDFQLELVDGLTLLNPSFLIH